MIRCGDSMFSLEHLYVSESEGHIIGIILWIKGALEWSDEVFLKCAEEQGLQISPYFERVKEEYFSYYSMTKDYEISIVNVCVDQKAHGKGIGKRMMQSFLSEECIHDTVCELSVLKGNIPAIRLYSENGFVITDEMPGFSVDKQKPTCLQMIRNKGMV